MYKKKEQLLALKVNFLDTEDIKLTADSLRAYNLWKGDCCWLHRAYSIFRHIVLIFS